MVAESYSVSLASKLVVPKNHRIPAGYYRSRLFIHSSVTNPLVAAAGPLLSLLERLSISPTLPQINIIRENIEHELYAFHSRLTGQQYAEEFIIIACYLLTATIDESLGKNYCRIYGQPTEFKAFTPSSFDDIGPQQRFFDIIQHIKERTNQYLDLIELAYYCLIAGFEGEQHLRPDGKQYLDNLTEELYQLIQRHRANKPHRLFKEEAPQTPPPTNNHRSSIIAIILALSAVIGIYFTSHFLLEHKAKTVILGNTMFAHLDR